MHDLVANEPCRSTDEIQYIEDVAKELLEWATEEGITQKAMNKLVAIFRRRSQISKEAMREGIRDKFPSLDKDVVNFAACNNMWRM